MPSPTVSGVIPAVPTPVSTKGLPDTSRLIYFCHKLLEEGADGLNITGTTGEATSLSCNQRLDIISALADSKLNKNQLIVGSGAASVSEAVKLSCAVGEAGLAGALVLPPFYFKDPSPAGLLRYFEAIVSATAASDLNIYLYNFPALSGITFTPELVGALMHEFGPRIKGLKDSSGSLDYASDIAERHPDLKVFPSNESFLIQAHEGKFAGTISATSNLSVPACTAAFRNGDKEGLAKAKAVRALISRGPLVPRIKAVLSLRLHDSEWENVLPPYVKLQPDEAQLLLNQINNIS